MDFIPKRKEVYAKIWSRGGNLIQETCCSIVPRGTLAGWTQEEKIFGGYYITYLQHTAVQSWWDLCFVDIVSLSALPAKHYNFDWIG